MMDDLYEVAKTMLERCLQVGEDTNILIVCDEDRLRIADALAFAADEIKAIPAVIVITNRFRKTSTVRDGILSKGVQRAVREMDIVILCLANVQRELEFRRTFVRAIRRSPVRVANLPGITEKAFMKIGETPKRSEVEKMGNDVARLLANGKKVRVTSPSGTKIEFELYGWKVPPEISTGYLLQPSTWGNLPGAEVYTAPLAWSTNGTLVIDLTIDQDHKLISPITFQVENGRAVLSSVKSRDRVAVRLLKKTLRQKNGDAICEFGFGLNRNIEAPTGITLIDEKIYGTAHFALGDNFEFGGEIKAHLHYDMVFTKPSVWVDDKQIMKDGEFVYTERDIVNDYSCFDGAIPETAVVRSTPWATCARMDGGLAQLWKGGSGRMHAFILGNRETSQLAERVWTAISHGGSAVTEISRSASISLGKTKKVIEFLVFHGVLEIVTNASSNERLKDLSRRTQAEHKIELL